MPSWSSVSAFALQTLLIFASVLSVGASCVGPELPPPPPDPPPAVFDELASGACPATYDWYLNDFDTWADAYCRAQGYSAEDCATFSPEAP